MCVRVCKRERELGQLIWVSKKILVGAQQKQSVKYNHQEVLNRNLLLLRLEDLALTDSRTKLHVERLIVALLIMMGTLLFTTLSWC